MSEWVWCVGACVRAWRRMRLRLRLNRNLKAYGLSLRLKVSLMCECIASMMSHTHTVHCATVSVTLVHIICHYHFIAIIQYTRT